MNIHDFLYEIKARLALGEKDNDFSYWVENTLADYYKRFEQENVDLAREMNDYLPDICEQMEPGMVSDKFHAELSAETERLLDLMKDLKNM